jgi:Secretion system C-terminal sorting domain
MKKHFTKILITIVLILFSNGISRSQNTNPSEFLPLKVGNVWVYSCNQYGNPPQPLCGICTKRIRVILTNTSVIDGKTFYQGNVTVIHILGSCPGCNSNLPGFGSYIRIDSLTGNVLGYSTNGGCSYRPNEILYDSLNARLYDSIRYDCQPPQQWTAYVCRDTSNIVIFGQSRQGRNYSIEGFESGQGRSYVKGIGITASGSSAVFCINFAQLLGCVINGIVYGDTSTIVSIRQISSEIPNKFSLSQNYPNPFNPKSNIKFQIAKTGYVKLVVSDALGKEVTALVNEKLNPGTYEVEWDGTNYPSGVYFYKLITENYSETRKMVLVK